MEQVLIYTYTHTHTYIQVVNGCLLDGTGPDLYIHTYVYTYIHTYIHTHRLSMAACWMAQGLNASKITSLRAWWTRVATILHYRHTVKVNLHTSGTIGNIL